jgi:hypothetical protein
MVKPISTKKYTVVEIQEWRSLVKKFYDEKHPNIKLNSTENKYIDLENDVNGYLKNRNINLRVSTRFLRDKYYNKINPLKNIHVAEWQAVQEYIESLYQTANSSEELINAKNYGIHDEYYIYYYLSYNEHEKRYVTKFALVGFDIDKATSEWSGGNIYYFDFENKIKKFDVERLVTVPTNEKALFFTAKFKSQINFFTVKINSRPIDKRQVLPLTYSVMETQHEYICSGKGFLEKIVKNKYKEKLRDLFKGVDHRFINALHSQKIVSDDLIAENDTEFVNNQTILLNSVSGIWKGYFLRSDFENPEKSNEKGGICKFALYIKGSGECEMYYELEKNDVFHKYTGFALFPNDKTSPLKINLEQLKGKTTHRMYIFMSPPTGVANPPYSGIISGWSNVSEKIYSSVIYMKKIKKDTELKNNEDVVSTIKSICPMRIFKYNDDNDRLNEDEKKEIKILIDKEADYLCTKENSISAKLKEYIKNL